MSFLVNSSGSSEFGVGYGLLVDIAISALSFTTYYILVHNFLDLSSYNLKKSVDLDMRNRIVAFTHGIVCFILAVRVVLCYP